MKPVIFKKGDTVIYIPNHAEGDENHKDCKYGLVTSFNNEFVFVKYGRFGGSAATMRKNLVHR